MNIPNNKEHTLCEVTQAINDVGKFLGYTFLEYIQIRVLLPKFALYGWQMKPKEALRVKGSFR